MRPSISIILCSLQKWEMMKELPEIRKYYNLKAPTWSKLLSQMDRRLINAWDEKKSLNQLQALCCTMSEHQSTSLKLINYLVHNTFTLTSKVKSLTTNHARQLSTCTGTILRNVSFNALVLSVRKVDLMMRIYISKGCNINGADCINEQWRWGRRVVLWNINTSNTAKTASSGTTYQ